MIVIDVDDREKYSMFFPKSRRKLIDDYPELGKIDAFRKLNRSEMLFVWYYACQASPYYDQDDFGRIIDLCLKKSFGKGMGRKSRERFISGNFPEKITAAIEVMRRFEPGPRIRAKKLVEKILENFEKLINIDVENDAQFVDPDGGINVNKKNAYVGLSVRISNQMPNLLAQVEEGYGITSLDGHDPEEEGSSLIESYHQEQ